MTLLTLGTTFFMPFALPLMLSGLQTSPWGIARPLVALPDVPHRRIGAFGRAIDQLHEERLPTSLSGFRPSLVVAE